VPLVDSMAVTKRSEAYRGYVIHACAQPVAKQLQLSYRASAEIVKDGRRIERSGLIGPRFADNATAEGYAIDWARDWIERHEAAAQARLETVDETPAGQLQAAQESQSDALEPALAAVPPQPARVLEPSMIRSRTPEWLLHAHPDGRGDTKPPELLFHA
jgi:hypothetical protein